MVRTVRLPRHVLSAGVLVLLTTSRLFAQDFATTCTDTTAQTVTARGTELLVNNQPRFTVLVSYFDAMRASPAALELDFAFLKRKGIGGIRIFPLWIGFAGTPNAQGKDATLLDADGRVRSTERWTHFATVLDKAARCGFIVDVSWNREMLFTLGEFTVAEFHGDPGQTTCAGGAGGSGIAEIACRMKGPRFSHAIFDLQNERDRTVPGMHLTNAEVKSVRDAVKRIDPARLLMVSQGPGDEALAVARDAALDIIAFHEEQGPHAYEKTAAHVSAMKVSGKPVYVQEGPRATLPGEPPRGVTCAPEAAGDPNPFFSGVKAARAAGAAAWTFHTDAGFYLDKQSFQQQIAECPREADFLNRLASELKR